MIPSKGSPRPWRPPPSHGASGKRLRAAGGGKQDSCDLTVSPPPVGSLPMTGGSVVEFRSLQKRAGVGWVPLSASEHILVGHRGFL